MNSSEVSEALRASGAATDDCPDLFLRVAAGVGRRRRRQRTAVGVALVVTVAVALAVPAVGAGSSGSTVSAEGYVASSVRDSCASDRSLPSNSFVRRAEALAGTTCTSAVAVLPAPFAWHHTARRYGLEQP
ncbi:hypothetical protein acdb102_29040 [Acidothermaceae bacterium B102]|nr:hypothetical protein acdb102_29040 [Acidothermaceae bacterium B102]